MTWLVSLLSLLGAKTAGYKTYLGAAGLLGAALYQFSLGDYPQAAVSLCQAVVAAGLRSALDKWLGKAGLPPLTKE
jgi:hypothetical protein